MQEYPLEILNAVVGECLDALRRLAPDPSPCPVKLEARERATTVLPVVISQRFHGELRALVNVSMDLTTALDIADRVLKASGGYAAGFTAREQKALRKTFAGIPEAAAKARGGAVGASDPRLSFGQRIATSTPFCHRPLTAWLRFAGGRVEVDVALARPPRAPDSQENPHGDAGVA